MPQHVSVTWPTRRGTFGSIPFWLGQAPLFVVVFAAVGLAVRRHWIAFVILASCAWVYGRVLRHPYFATRLEKLAARVTLAIVSRYPKRPAPVEVAAVPTASDPDEAPPAPLVEPVRPRRAPARVASSPRSPTKRLLQLEELRETGLVSAAEYYDKRQEILRAI